MVLQDTIYYFSTLGKEIPSKIKIKTKDCLISDEVNAELIKQIKASSAKVVFIGNENIYSHNMNVLRKASLNYDLIIIIGIAKIISKIKHSEECILRLPKRIIEVGKMSYSFQEFNISVDADELLDYNIKNKMICYKPTYYYSQELANIVQAGFNNSKIMIGEQSVTYISEKKRIWNVGIGFPTEIYDKICNNKLEYFKSLKEYLVVLKRLLTFLPQNDFSEDLKNTLVDHFSYSTLFSFILSKISNDLNVEVSNQVKMESYYTIFAKTTPINDKYVNTVPTIDKLNTLLDGLISNEADILCKVFPEFENIKITDTVILFFVMHMFSDLRRCVISMLIESNTWFKSICTHKRRETQVF